MQEADTKLREERDLQTARYSDLSHRLEEVTSHAKETESHKKALQQKVKELVKEVESLKNFSQTSKQRLQALTKENADLRLARVEREKALIGEIKRLQAIEKQNEVKARPAHPTTQNLDANSFIRSLVEECDDDAGLLLVS